MTNHALPQGGAVLLAFLAAGLGFVSLVLLWEWVRAFRRQYVARKQLKGIERRPEQPTGAGTGLYREVRKGLPTWLAPLLARVPQARDIEHLLNQADVPWSVPTFAVLSLGFAAVAGLVGIMFGHSWVVAAGAAAFGSTFPLLHLRRRRKKRLAAFEEGLPEAIDLLGRSIRAGHAFSTGMKIVAEESPAPVSTEFKQVFEEQKFGLPLEDSMLALSDRIPLVDVRIFVTAILVQRDVGGNLAEILDKISYTIRERFMIMRQVRVHTAQGRMTGYLLAALPIIIATLVFMLNREYISILVHVPVGKFMLGAAVVMQVVGFLLIRRIIQIEV